MNLENQKKAAEQMRGLEIAYKKAFDSVEGQRVLMDLMEVGHMFNNTFDPCSSTHSFNEGKRNMVLYILQKINSDNGIKYMEQLNKKIGGLRGG